MNIEMGNGMQMTLEMYMHQSYQEQTAGALEHHVRTSLLPENGQDWTETDQALYEKFLDSWKSKKSKTDLNGLSMKNVKGMLSSNKGLDYLSILSEMDRLGYDIEWQNINSKWFVPQNRERIYTVGHLRRYGSAKVLPIEGTNCKNSVSTKEIKYPCFVDMNYGAGIKTTEIARALQSRYYKGVSSRNREVSGVAVNPCNSDIIAIRKLTPKECFRLQGWDDDYFERAAMVCSDTQLYKQAGNGITVPVVEAIGKEIAKYERKSV